eukprot:324786-Chlamydomonas_euryale.AAC.5
MTSHAACGRSVPSSVRDRSGSDAAAGSTTRAAASESTVRVISSPAGRGRCSGMGSGGRVRGPGYSGTAVRADVMASSRVGSKR